MSSCGDAATGGSRAHVGSRSAWLRKEKGDNAKAKWFSRSTKRYFTLDFDSQSIYYSSSEDRTKVLQTIRFQDVVSTEQLPQATRSAEGSGFRLTTTKRTYDIYTTTDVDAQDWVDGLNAARDIGTANQRHEQLLHDKLEVSMNIGYIGSPENLKDERVKQRICELLSNLVTCDARVYVGPPNAELKTELAAPASIVVQNMQNVNVGMFDAVIVTPGGPGTEAEAKRFQGHAKLYCFTNSASEYDAPSWFRDLLTESMFDLQQSYSSTIDHVTQAIIKPTSETGVSKTLIIRTTAGTGSSCTTMERHCP